MKTLKRIILPTLLLCLSAVHLSAQKNPDKNKDADAAAAESYAATVLKFVEKESKPHLVITDVADFSEAEEAEWQTYASEEEFENAGVESYTTAYIWKKDGRVVQVNFTYSSPSGDWAEYFLHTYRPDGSVARVERDFRTFLGDVIVNTIWLYDPLGKTLGEKKTFRDLNTQNEIKPTDNYMDVEFGKPYLKISELPFAALLGTAKADAFGAHVPAGWKLEDTLTGDLNGDPHGDAVLQLLNANDEDGDHNRRLVILFGKKGGGYEKAAESDKVLRCSLCGGILGGGPADVKIEKGVLIVSQMYGSRAATDYLHRFRYESSTGKFRLIGEDVTNFDRATGASETVSSNYLTGRRIVKKMRYDQKTEKDVVVSNKTDKISREKKYLEDVDYSNY